MSLFILCFIPLFVAVDAPGVMPLFLNLTSEVDPKKLGRIIMLSMLTALVTGLLFIWVGKIVLDYIGITIADFMVAGGLLLFALSMGDLLRFEKKRRAVQVEDISAVPIGVPLIVGPSVLTTSMLLVGQYGLMNTALALTANIVIAGALFWSSTFIVRIVGTNISAVLSKVAGLLLAAFGVMMVRRGIEMYMVAWGS